jgi:CTP synthase
MFTMKTKYIFVTGGVISSLGKGIATSSIGLLLQSRGFNVSCMKCEMYVNIDAGTIRPTEHGEVFVTNDGMETDQDIGNYERFLNRPLTGKSYITTGQIYQRIIERERNFEYEGEDVEVVPHVPEEIIHRIKELGKKEKADFVLIEVGGTVGEYQNILFLEADRLLARKQKGDVLNIHMSYLPIPESVGEMKTKPVQTSTRMLNTAGIFPDIIIGRAQKPLDKKRKEKISTFCNVDIEDVFSNPTADSIYQVPMILEKQGIADRILEKFGIEKRTPDLAEWEDMVKRATKSTNEVNIGIIGKYLATGEYSLEDSYISVAESIKHAAWSLDRKPKITWIDAEVYENDPEALKKLSNLDGVIVPGGFGKRGLEGKIKAIQYVRENNIPFLGICLGLQMATIEIARNKAGITDAATTEVDKDTKNPVIYELPGQKELIKNSKMGGTMRLGAYPCEIKQGTLAHRAYEKTSISERHRHRYEVNNDYLPQLEAAGFVGSGINPDLNLVEIGEYSDHPYFIGAQFHPEFQSHPLRPHPLFVGLIKAAISS